MRVIIKRCSDPFYWYADKIGCEWNVRRDCGDEYIVRASDGFLNIIKKKDCEVIENEDRRK